MAKDYFYHNGMLLSEDELMHFKYIKRERKNGRWVYYYDQSDLDKKKEAAKKAEIDQVNAAIKVAKASDEQADHMKSSPGIMTKSEAKKRSAEAAKLDKNVSDALAERANAAKKADNAQKAYEKERRSTSVQRAISKGTVVVANALSKLEAKLSKKKKKKK